MIDNVIKQPPVELSAVAAIWFNSVYSTTYENSRMTVMYHILRLDQCFYLRDAMLARVIVIAMCPSVCPSVCLSVTCRYCVKRRKLAA